MGVLGQRVGGGRDVGFHGEFKRGEGHLRVAPFHYECKGAQFAGSVVEFPDGKVEGAR